MDEQICTYRIDRNDVITHISPNWSAFARTNRWTTEPGADNIVGNVLWDFFQGDEIRHLFEQLFRKARSGTSIRPISFRCDSPQERRFLPLLIFPLADGPLEVASKIIRSEFRDAVSLLDNDAPKSGDLLKICSMCKKIAVDLQTWVEIEEGLQRLRLFEVEKMPRLTHGVCPDCFRQAMAELDRQDQTGLPGTTRA